MQLMPRVELNITFRCTLACKGCNRLCDLGPLDGDMTLQQIELFVQKLRDEDKHCNRIKMVGGEPTVHPQFLEMCEVLSSAVTTGHVGKVVVNSNGTTQKKFEDVSLPSGVFWKFSPSRRKKHRPYLWSPRDLCLVSKGPCKMPRVCGLSLDVKGWLPCSAAIAIARLFDLERLYKPLDGPLPMGVWGMEELCPDCIFGVVDFHGRGLADMPAMHVMPSPRWADVLWRNRERFTR